MPRKKWDRDGSKELIEQIYANDPKLNYDTLRNQHGDTLTIARQQLSDDKELMAKIDKIYQRALVISVQSLPKTKQNPSSIARKHSSLWRQAKISYPDNPRLSGLSQCLKEAELLNEEERIRYDETTLCDVLERFEAYSRDPEDFRIKKIRGSGNGTLIDIIHSRPEIFGRRGKQGKVAILTGLDYGNLPKVHRHILGFEYEQIKKILEDDSLTDDWQLRCAFNILAMQYYNWDGYSKPTTRNFDTVPIGPASSINYFADDFFKVKVHALREQKIVSIILDNCVPNPIHAVTYLFKGPDFQEDSKRFTKYFQKVLKLIE
jgi:hypothetical protein